MGVAPFEDRQLETDYQEASRVLANPPRVQQKSLLLLGSLAAFVAVSVAQGTSSVMDLATLVGVLLVHELGHALAMLVVGYRDVRIFFIPFFGAAAAGRKHGVARWKQAIVLLAGPLPGVVAGGVLLLVATPVPRIVALQLLVINGLNLLPLVPLDGGQLAQLLLFSRQRHLEIVFQGLTAAALVAFAVSRELWVLAAVGYVLLVTLGHRKRMLEVAHRWRDREPPEDPARLDEVSRRALFRDAWDMLPPKWQVRWRGKPRPQAATMQQIFERAAQRPPSWAASGAILAVWAAALAFAVWVLLAALAPHWQRHEHQTPHFTCEMPGHPKDSSILGGRMFATSVGKREYGVVWTDAPDAGWIDRTRGVLLVTNKLVREVPGAPGEQWFVAHKDDHVIVARLLVAHGTGFMVLATAPSEDPDSFRFVQSFAP